MPSFGVHKQPIARVPDLAADGFVSGWLNADQSRGLGVDSGPDGYDMTVFNPLDVQWQSGGGALFGGTNGYLRRDVADWRIADEQGFFTMWCKLNAGGFEQTLLSSGDAGGAHLFKVSIRAFNRIACQAYSIGNFNDLPYGNSTLLTTGVWYFLALGSDGTAYHIYINGIEETLGFSGGADNGHWLADIPSRDRISIGARTWNVTDEYFSGEIRDVRYYSVALT